MIYDELIEELALTLLTKARYEGCISVIDGFSQCEEDKTRIEYPIDGVMRYRRLQRMVGYQKEADGSQLAAEYGDEQRG